MVSAKISQALENISSSPDRYQEIGNLLKVVTSRDKTELTTNFSAIVDTIFAQNLGIVTTRSLLVAVGDLLRSLEDNATKIAVGEHIVKYLSHQVSSFEEQYIQILEIIATSFENNDDFLEAAKILARIPLESSQRKVTSEDKVKIWIRITRYYLEVDDTTLAEQYLNKAKNFIYAVEDRDLNLHFKLCQARIQDSKREFLSAAQGYQDISFMPIIAEEEKLHTLSMAIKCAVLAPAGPARSRTLGRLYKDERVSSLEEFGILEKMFLDRVLSPDEVAKFAEGLAPHQLAKTSDGSNVLAKAVIEHNLRGASRLYNNIGFDALGILLGLDSDKAEETTARMIEQGRLVGRIDQIKRIIWFETSEAAGEEGACISKEVACRELKRWDANVQSIAEEVEKVTTELQLRYPEFVSRHLAI
ncbi:putative cop9 signalosome complex subunit 4 [Erysiphe necator]|uniref:COP9 signalosome complex subunit 4 n=1 Tax=Uncinula necator TaxID=52586 RepID=A0A0B1P580_UNCNE|nr:putative cop9 signalosome complex subunit 4 [Erysiphe necator]